MRRIGRRNSILVIIISIVVGGILLAPSLLGIGSVPEDDGLWFTIGPYQHLDNDTFSVLFHGVNFTFLYYLNHRYLDAPFPVFISVEFADGTIEALSLGIGGWTLENRVNFTEHTNPKAAVFTTNSPDDILHYSWFYAVELI
ncbi:MAG: hypothetical protein RTU30_08080 [Candidatus Thorarchaeota archaeon]